MPNVPKPMADRATRLELNLRAGGPRKARVFLPAAGKGSGGLGTGMQHPSRVAVTGKAIVS
jgi:hypothetical protein